MKFLDFFLLKTNGNEQASLISFSLVQEGIRDSFSLDLAENNSYLIDLSKVKKLL